MKVVFLGTPGFAIPTLKALIASPDCDLLAVITQPDRKSGRGQQLHPPPVKVVAQEAGIPVHQFTTFRNNAEPVQLLNYCSPDVCVVVAFGQILPIDFFDVPPFGTLNVHASILPAYRGAAPVVHTLLHGEQVTGVTIMRIDEGMDTGEILAVRTVEISDEATAGELADRLAQLGADLLLPTMQGYLSGHIEPAPQGASGVSYAPRIKKQDGAVNWSKSSREIHNQIRAMNPQPGAFSLWRDREVKIWRSRLDEVGGLAEAEPGVIIDLEPNALRVQCGRQESLLITELQLPSRDRLTASEFVNGMRAEKGERFSPVASLEAAG